MDRCHSPESAVTHSLQTLCSPHALRKEDAEGEDWLITPLNVLEVSSILLTVDSLCIWEPLRQEAERFFSALKKALQDYQGNQKGAPLDDHPWYSFVWDAERSLKLLLEAARNLYILLNDQGKSFLRQRLKNLKNKG